MAHLLLFVSIYSDWSFCGPSSLCTCPFMGFCGIRYMQMSCFALLLSDKHIHLSTKKISISEIFVNLEENSFF